MRVSGELVQLVKILWDTTAVKCIIEKQKRKEKKKKRRYVSKAHIFNAIWFDRPKQTWNVFDLFLLGSLSSFRCPWLAISVGINTNHKEMVQVYQNNFKNLKLLTSSNFVSCAAFNKRLQCNFLCLHQNSFPSSLQSAYVTWKTVSYWHLLEFEIIGEKEMEDPLPHNLSVCNGAFFHLGRKEVEGDRSCSL